MKLVEIWNSVSAWSTISKLKKNPKLAYRLLKYEKRVDKELQVCEKQRQACVYEVRGVEPGTEVEALLEGTPEYATFLAKFNEFMQAESDLQWIGISMDDLLDGLGAETGNVLSEYDIELLEPFFTEPMQPESPQA